ncbi:hypothetical protein WJX81_002841 [Elliptochloris bilobata]|uniref:Uncharacterized protein n=1 Tax=Elliptochloris bilobata TaxID=381761 RepID=A0AAW1RUF0_9CHLO
MLAACVFLSPRAPVLASLGSWRDPDAPLGVRVEDLLQRLTLAEKVEQLSAARDAVGAIPRLGIPAFQGWNECLHGVWDLFSDANRPPTVFPAPIALAAAFDADLLHRVAGAIGDETRAKANIYLAKENKVRMLNCFAPNINIARDPRWGRGHETYGEDPFLTGRMATAFVRGLQGNDSTYIKVAATCKHFAAYSLEAAEGFTRQTFDAHVNERDMHASYGPAFKACIQEARVESVMCSYNSVNGKPACASPELLQGTLRGVYGFQGVIVSDCGAVDSIFHLHEYTNSSAEGHAAALLAGTDAACVSFQELPEAVRRGLIVEADIDAALQRYLAARFRLGVFDPPERLPWAKMGPGDVGSNQNEDLALEAARKGIVLLKNRHAALPLDAGRLRRVVLVGPHANASEHMLGNYYGRPARVVTPLQAFQEALGPEHVGYQRGAFLEGWGGDGEMDGAAFDCRDSDACIIFLGLSALGVSDYHPPLYNEHGEYALWSPHDEAEGYDRVSLRLPGMQEGLLQHLARLTDTPLVLVLVHGSAVDVAWAEASPRVGAILSAFYPGQMGGQAIADIILGKEAPSGRLPVTFYYRNYTDQISAAEMDMVRWPGRTHRYVKVPVIYPFGHGLSYTEWRYSGLQATPRRHPGAASSAQSYNVSVMLTNAGDREAEEVVLLVLTCRPAQRASAEERAAFDLPGRSLRGFQRIALRPGESKLVRFELGGADFAEVLVQR